MIWNKIKRKAKKILGLKPKQLWIHNQSECVMHDNCNLNNSKIILNGNSKLIVEDSVIIKNCNITLSNSILRISNSTELSAVSFSLNENSEVHINSEVIISEYDFHLNNSKLKIGTNCQFVKGKNALRPSIRLSNGILECNTNNLIKADFWVRFGGICKIGSYNCINEESELRCDENIKIGDFNMISYQCDIWDTNTHCQYNKDKRRAITVKDFPYIGDEFERPITKPIKIGNDTWIGKRAQILKGSIVSDEAIVATSAVVTNLNVLSNSIAIGNPAIIKLKK